MITTQTIELSMTPEITVLPEVYCSQYDNGIRQVVFELFEDAEKTTPYNVDGLSAIVEGTKPDGNAYAQNATASGSSVTVTIGTQMAAVAGIVPSEIVLRHNDQRVGSLNFLLMVEPAGILDGSVVSDSEIPAYVDSAEESAEAAAASQAAAAASQAAAATSEANAAASETAAAASETNAAESETAAAASQAAAATSEANAAESAEASEYWAKQSMEGKTLATLPDVSLPETIPDGSLLSYDAASRKWERRTKPITTQYGGTGNADGYIRTGAGSRTTGAAATAEGVETTSSGTAAHAEGKETQATGDYSHAEGWQTVASGKMSHAGGARVEADKYGALVQGALADKFGIDSAFVFGYAPSDTKLSPPGEINTNKNITANYGASGIITEVTTVTITLEPAAIYLLFCNAFTLATGAIYGATARLISCLPTTGGTPNILSLGQTTNAPATIAAAANHTITIANAAAARGVQFTLIRVA